MAERRMFAKTIIDSDAFLDMPLSTQALYFHLVMRGDDEGFVNNPKKIMRMVGASDDEMKVLITKRFLIPFESGVVVVKHWFIHNYIQKDRFKRTVYIAERGRLSLKENGSYTENGVDTGCIQNASNMDTGCIQNASNLDAQYKLKETNINKTNLSGADKPQKHKYGEYKNVLLTDDELEKLKTQFTDWSDRIERLSEYIESKGVKYKSHLATIRAWSRKDKTPTPDVNWAVSE